MDDTTSKLQDLNQRIIALRRNIESTAPVTIATWLYPDGVVYVDRAILENEGIEFGDLCVSVHHALVAITKDEFKTLIAKWDADTDLDNLTIAQLINVYLNLGEKTARGLPVGHRGWVDVSNTVSWRYVIYPRLELISELCQLITGLSETIRNISIDNPILMVLFQNCSAAVDHFDRELRGYWLSYESKGVKFSADLKDCKLAIKKYFESYVNLKRGTSGECPCTDDRVDNIRCQRCVCDSS